MNGDLQLLITAVCDNRATDAELAQLAELLRDNPDARDEYLRYVDLHAALSDEALPSFESDVIDYRVGSNISASASGSNKKQRSA